MSPLPQEQMHKLFAEDEGEALHTMINEDYDDVELTKNYSPTKLERETIITYNDEESTAEVYTMNQPLIRKLDALCLTNEDITCVKSEKIGTAYAKEYIVPKKWVKVSPPRKVTLSEEQKKAVAERLAQSRESKNSQD